MPRSSCGIYEALWLARLHQALAGALYLHVPFCVQKCAYCDFASRATSPTDPLMAAYVQALCRLLDEAGSAGLLDGCETAYVGGGTPTLLGDGLHDLVATLARLAGGLRELTCEANPDSLTNELLVALPDAGCTRLSIGVQSLQDTELRELGRIHTAEQALERLRAAVAHVANVSCDLMCAIPHQTDVSWLRTLAQVVDSGVSHVSVYPLQIEEGTPFDVRFGEAACPWNDSEVQAARMRMAAQVLEGAGFARYEVASYAREGCACAHNSAYWTAVPYLGLGVRASSMLAREGYERLRGAAPQLPELDGSVRRVRLTCTNDARSLAGARGLCDLHFDLECLDEGQAAAEDLMLAMRMARGAGPGLVAHARAVLGPNVDEALDSCAQRGLAAERGGSWVPTQDGWLLGNELYGRLWELAPGEVTTIHSC